MWHGSVLGIAGRCNAVACSEDPVQLPEHWCLALFEMPLSFLPVPAASLEKRRSPVDPVSSLLAWHASLGYPAASQLLEASVQATESSKACLRHRLSRGASQE